MTIKEAIKHIAVTELQIGGYAEKREVLAKLSEERKLANLSQAASLQGNNVYWICTNGRELEPRTINGRGYEGRNFEGMPFEQGHYLINEDNTFTMLRDKEDADWSKRLYVSNFAAAKATQSEGIVILYIMRNMSYFTHLDNVLTIFASDVKPSNVALITSVPKNASADIRISIAAAKAARG